MPPCVVWPLGIGRTSSANGNTVTGRCVSFVLVGPSDVKFTDSQTCEHNERSTSMGREKPLIFRVSRLAEVF